MLPRRTFLSLAAFAAALTNGVVRSQPPKQQPPLQPLGDVLHLVFDQDKNQKVTMEEVNQQMTMLEMLLGSAEGPEGEEYRRLLGSAKTAAPTLFRLLDSNGDDALSKAELAYATKFEKSLAKDGGMRELVRNAFEILDDDDDERVSAEELRAFGRGGDGGDDDGLGRLTLKFHALFPLRDTPEELESFVRDLLGGRALDPEDAAEYVAWLDDDGDGFVQRGEVGRHYKSAGKQFLNIAKTIKQMGPMMAMFGGGGMMNPGGRPGGGFKMDL